MGRSRCRLTVTGAVQGVGFRPFVYRLARELGLSGWVRNDGRGVTAEAEGPEDRLFAFRSRLASEKPVHAYIQSIESVILEPAGYDGFAIRQSERGGPSTALILPDIAPCSECMAEVFDPGNRRWLYPFTNCTHCGPRYTIIEALPYDRASTSMRGFRMCAACLGEYSDPSNRRFHAQPNACGECGPSLSLWDARGNVLARRQEAAEGAARLLEEGRVVAVKGVGGFHLCVSAGDERAVLRLRERKGREEKPLAVMCADVSQAEELCAVGPLERELLLSPQAPIVLLNRRARELSRSRVAECVAPGNPMLGLMLPPTPLHHILVRRLGGPIVATSGNLSDEPICTGEQEALSRLHGIADAYLVHDRPILRHVDDSIVRVIRSREMVLRRGRGYAPLPLPPAGIPGEVVLAVGGHLKAAVALGTEGGVFVSQHIGDLETAPAYETFRKVAGDLQALLGVSPTRIVCDSHPDYLSSAFAQQTGLPLVRVQHHAAHVASCMAENELSGTVLGVAWDGAGYGPDGTIWGGEFLLHEEGEFRRFGSILPFGLPGGDAASRQPRRSALGLLYECFGSDARLMHDLPAVRSFGPAELDLLLRVVASPGACPRTSSMGRLFDGVSALLGLRFESGFEAQAAMELEFRAMEASGPEAYPWTWLRNPSGPPLVADWRPMIRAILEDVRRGIGPAAPALKFHNTLVQMIAGAAREAGVGQVALSGGCFQNKLLTELAIEALEASGVRAYWHQRVPPNDGGLALGQIAAAGAARPTGAAHEEGGKEENHVSGRSR
ncbi:MAG: carbamoyltransferase HypF [Bacteroidota bacterium]